MTIRSYVLLGVAALALGGLGCSDPCGDLKSECADCGDSQELCEATVDLVSEVGGDDACQDLLDAGGVNCDGAGGGS
jgi:hypothetical protein